MCGSCCVLMCCPGRDPCKPGIYEYDRDTDMQCGGCCAGPCCFGLCRPFRTMAPCTICDCFNGCSLCCIDCNRLTLNQLCSPVCCAETKEEIRQLECCCCYCCCPCLQPLENCLRHLCMWTFHICCCQWCEVCKCKSGPKYPPPRVLKGCCGARKPLDEQELLHHDRTARLGQDPLGIFVDDDPLSRVWDGKVTSKSDFNRASVKYTETGPQKVEVHHEVEHENPYLEDHEGNTITSRPLGGLEKSVSVCTKYVPCWHYYDVICDTHLY